MTKISLLLLSVFLFHCGCRRYIPQKKGASESEAATTSLTVSTASTSTNTALDLANLEALIVLTDGTSPTSTDTGLGLAGPTSFKVTASMKNMVNNLLSTLGFGKAKRGKPENRPSSQDFVSSEERAVPSSHLETGAVWEKVEGRSEHKVTFAGMNLRVRFVTPEGITAGSLVPAHKGGEIGVITQDMQEMFNRNSAAEKQLFDLQKLRAKINASKQAKETLAKAQANMAVAEKILGELTMENRTHWIETAGTAAEKANKDLAKAKSILADAEKTGDVTIARARQIKNATQAVKAAEVAVKQAEMMKNAPQALEDAKAEAKKAVLPENAGKRENALTNILKDYANYLNLNALGKATANRDAAKAAGRSALLFDDEIASLTKSTNDYSAGRDAAIPTMEQLSADLENLRNETPKSLLVLQNKIFAAAARDPKGVRLIRVRSSNASKQELIEKKAAIENKEYFYTDALVQLQDGTVIRIFLDPNFKGRLSITNLGKEHLNDKKWTSYYEELDEIDLRRAPNYSPTP